MYKQRISSMIYFYVLYLRKPYTTLCTDSPVTLRSFYSYLPVRRLGFVPEGEVRAARSAGTGLRRSSRPSGRSSTLPVTAPITKLSTLNLEVNPSTDVQPTI
jgi:hypothetical protein